MIECIHLQASIMRAGEIIGVWAWDRRARRITRTLTTTTTAALRREIDDRLAAMETFLRAEPLHGVTG